MAEVNKPDPEASPAFEPAATPVSASFTSSFDRVIRQARARLLFFAFLESLCAAAAGAGAGLVVALVVVGVAPFSIPLRVLLLALIAGAGAGAVAYVARRAWALRHDVVVGGRIEDALRRRGIDLRDAVRGAVELRDAVHDAALGRSRALCDAHVEATGQRVVEGGALSSLPGVAVERALPTLVATGAVMFIVLAWSIAGSSSWNARWDRLFTDAGVEKALEERAASLTPLVTDLKLTLRFPAYMAEADEVIPGSSGDVTAPRGTEVVVEGRAADRKVTRASISVGDEELAAEVGADGRSVVGRFVVNAAGSYRFALDGDLDPVAHKISVAADRPPSVQLDEPAADKTVKMDDDVPLSYAGKDDVGITKFRLVVKRQGSAREPYMKDLMDVPGGLREARGVGIFKVSDTGARPGDKLSVYVEALDNDVVSGPNAGRSPTRVLTVFSAALQHRDVIARLEEVLSRMVDTLGDELESPIAGTVAADAKRVLDQHDAINTRQENVKKALDDALIALADDEIAPAATRRALANMRLKVTRAFDVKVAMHKTWAIALARGTLKPARGLVVAQNDLVERLEQDILYLEDLLNRERIAEARQVADDLKRAQEDLKALIDQFKKSGDDETRKALLDEIQRMRKQMAELMERLSKLQRDIPDEFLNHEAFEGDKLLQEAQDLDKLIEEGKLDEAAKALEQMLKQTQELVDELDKTGEEYGGDEYKELREKLNRFADDLEALEKGQEHALQQNQQMIDRARREAEERLKGKIDKALAEVKKKAEKAEAALKNCDKDSLFVHEHEDAQFAKARVEDLERAVDSREIDDAMQAAEEAAAAARSAERSVTDRMRGRFGQKDKQTADQKAALEEARTELEQAHKMLQELLPDPSSLLKQSDRDKLQSTADRQEQLREQAQRLEKLMDEVGEQAPVFGPSHKQRLVEAQEAMQRAGREMRMQNMRGARSAQRQALRQLSELGKDLREMGEGGGRSGQGGIPMPYPRGGSPGMDSEGDDGGDSGRHSSADVEIPDGSEFKVPDAYRKDILDAMREGVPESWAGEVKRYYEKLIK